MFVRVCFLQTRFDILRTHKLRGFISPKNKQPKRNNKLIILLA